jgi:hypothetical protein
LAAVADLVAAAIGWACRWLRRWWWG